MVAAQSKLNNYQQSQSDAVDVDDDSNLLGVIESFDLDPACVEGHEHGYQLQESLVDIWDGQPNNSTAVQTHKHIVSICDPIILMVSEWESIIPCYVILLE